MKVSMIIIGILLVQSVNASFGEFAGGTVVGKSSDGVEDCRSVNWEMLSSNADLDANIKCTVGPARRITDFKYQCHTYSGVFGYAVIAEASATYGCGKYIPEP